MRKSTLYVLLLLCVSSLLYSQQDIDTNYYKLRYGGFIDLGMNLYNVNFKKLPDVPNCCQGFTSGKGLGWSFGGVAEYPLNIDFMASLRLGIRSYGGIMTKNENVPIIIDGISKTGTIEHYLDINLAATGIEPEIKYRIFDELYIGLGAGLSLTSYSYFHQKEEIIDPPDKGTFKDSTRIRNDFSGKLKSANIFLASVNAGLSYNFIMNRRGSIIASPEIYYYYLLTPVISGIKWNIHSFMAGIAIKYKEPAALPPPPPLPPDPPDPKFPPAPPPAALTASVSVIQVDSTNTDMQDFTVKIEDFITFNMRPLLNYIFFDENSADISKRYIRVKPNEINNFDNKLLQGKDVLETYYQVLNITGSRLRNNPVAKIKLIGTNCNCNLEKNNKDLSKARSESIRNYFRDVWGIADDRMKIEVRNLPKEYSVSDEPGGDEENRRVEIIPDDTKILEPVVTIDTVRHISDYRLRFFPSVKAVAGLKLWKLSVNQSNKDLIKYTGTTHIPDSLEWNISQKDTSAPKTGGQIYYRLTVEDSLEQKAASPLNWLPIDQLTTERKRISKMADKEFEYYSLILFDFGKSTLGKEHNSVLDFVKNRVKPESKVLITGYSDRIGEEDVNLRISTRRAQAAAHRLNIPNAVVKGVGKSELLYDNTMPEGRFYCRTVKISIETPIKNGK